MNEKKNTVVVRKSSNSAPSAEAAPVVATIAPKPTSDKQRDWLLKAGVEESKIPTLSRDASKLMDKIIVERKRRGYGAPTEAQLSFLERAGYNREAMALRTKEFCSKLIAEIKSGRARF